MSTGDQVPNGSGLDAQRQAITAYAISQGWELVGIEEDQDTSGTYGVGDSNGDGTQRRPRLVAVVDALDGGQVDAVIIRASDRVGGAPASCVDAVGLALHQIEHRFNHPIGV